MEDTIETVIHKRTIEIAKWACRNIVRTDNFFGKFRFNSHFYIYLSTVNVKNIILFYLSIPGIATKSSVIILHTNRKQDVLEQSFKVKSVITAIFNRFNDSTYFYYKPIFKQLEFDRSVSRNTLKRQINRITSKETFLQDFDYYEEYNLKMHLTKDVDCVIPIDDAVLYARIAVYDISKKGDYVYHMSVLIPDEIAKLNKIKDSGLFREHVRQDHNFRDGGYDILLENCFEIRGSHMLVNNTHDFLDKLYTFAMSVKENFYKIYKKNSEHNVYLFRL
jgi:hypothetical protein